ncbi:MAG TPA: DUF3352 domain-containing protein [Solirubrobacterales bacterium]|nr:DUF3352 domain-containing protein [Solirubrobacterales bacterium]
MPKYLNRFTVPSIVAVTLTSFALAACGGSDSGDDAASNLAKYVPADASVYVEGTLRPDQDVADDVDSISTKLTGKSLSATIDEALAQAQDAELTYEADVKPWLGDNAALYVPEETISSAAATDVSVGDPATAMVDSSSDIFGMIAESTDVDASQAFIDKAAEAETPGGGEASGGEYEGFSYRISNSDGSVLGIVDDNVVMASSEDIFKAMVDASKGDSLEGNSTFSDVIGKAADDSIVDIYTPNEPLITSAQGGDDAFGLVNLYKALGGNLEDTGSVISLVPSADEISVVGVTNADAALVSGDPSAVIESFPANSLFATGSGDVGANITKVIDTIDKEGLGDVLKPGELNKQIDEISSQGLDIVSVAESLETVGFFVSGDSLDTLGGALLATTSDPQPLENALGAFSQLIGLADDAKVKPLRGDMTGFSVKTPELPGRPVVIAIQGDRLAIGIGMPATKQALSGSGETLADSDAYKAAEESLDGQNVDMFGNPAAIASVVESFTAGDPIGDKAVEIINKFEYMVSGSGSDDKTFAFNLGLKD